MTDNKLIELVQDIKDKLHSHKDSIQFVISYNAINENGVNTSYAIKHFDSPIYMNDSYELAVIGLETYNSYPNVTSSINGNFRYSDGTNWYTIVLPTGSYEVKSIATYILDNLVGSARGGITFVEEYAQLKVSIKLARGCQVDFSYPNSVNYILGFDPKIVSGDGKHYGENIVNINNVNTLFVNCNVIGNSYSNGKTISSIYGFSPNVSPGFKIIKEPTTPIYLPVTSSVMDAITVWITDQDNNLINFRGETVTVRFHLRTRE